MFVPRLEWQENLRDDHSSGRSSICSLEKTNTEGPSGWPTRAGLKVGENEFGRSSAVLGKGKNAHNNGDDSSESPENGEGLSKLSAQ